MSPSSRLTLAARSPLGRALAFTFGLGLGYEIFAAAPAHAQATPVDPESIGAAIFAPVDALASTARAQRADLLSPGHFANGEKALSDARRLYREQGEIKSLDEKLTRAKSEFEKAIAHVADAKAMLGPALAARDAAQDAEATVHDGETYGRAERAFNAAGLDLEQGKEKDAKVKAADAERGFRESEINSIRIAILGEAKRLLTKADKEKAAEWAPRHIDSAKNSVGEAERRLADDRYERSETLALARQAEADARRGLAVAEKARAAANDRTSYEAQLMDAESQIQMIGGALGYKPDFESGLKEPSEQIVRAIQGIKADRDTLQGELAHARSSLSALEAKERGLSAELEAKRSKEERFTRVSELFIPEEAVVIRERGGRLILRLKGVNFQRGNAVVLPESYALLGKVVRAMGELPGAAMTIEGHTDSQGDAARNVTLSQQRADAVRQYLEANANLSDRVVTTVGMGESTPIASNDNEEGRAQNRRIDVVFDAPNLIGD